MDKPSEKMSDAEKQALLLNTQLETALIQREQAIEANAKYKGEQRSREENNRKRQGQLRSEVNTRHRGTLSCNHRQGGSPSKPGSGKGPTALNVVLMPDGFTKLIMCSAGCRLRLFSPHPRDGAKAPRKATNLRPAETKADAEERVERCQLDLQRFNELLQKAEDDTLTPEAATPMDCGITITLTDSETGMPVLPWRPCDSAPRPDAA